MNNIDFELDIPETLIAPLSPEESLNGNYTAIPKGFDAAGEAGVDLDLVVDPMEYGEMNEPEAIESGYVSGAKADLIPDAIPSAPTAVTPSVRAYALPVLGLGALALLGWGIVRLISRAQND